MTPNQRLLAVAAVSALVGAVQFVNILDFTIVMPLGPDFSRALGIPSSNIGYVTAGAYPELEDDDTELRSVPLQFISVKCDAALRRVS